MTDQAASLAAALADRYRFERQLGAGGMATVYLAEDLKHHRKVAIKVLRPDLAAVIGAERFLQEIRTIAILQHPHILGLLDSGDAHGTAFYVMPFVEGESLRQRLGREKQLPVADAIRIATEVASALDYAHRHGVIHRDIKPENILLHDGQALVADFGIALAVSSAGGTRMTETGMSLGTPQYMAPEQAMGEREITARSDIYALGVITYEMLLGEPPFSGPTAQAIVAKVMTADPPPLQAQRRSVPPQVDAAVLTALEKLPADRFASAQEFAAALTGSAPVPHRFTRPRTLPRWALPAAFGAVLLLGVLAGGLTRSRAPVPGTFRVPVGLAAEPSVTGPSFALSPDGTQYLFRSRLVSLIQLYVQPLDSAGEARALTPPTSLTGLTSSGPRFSPDGRFAVIGQGGQLIVVPVQGGEPRYVADSAQGWGVWATDGRLYFRHMRTKGIASVPAAGGPVAFHTQPDSARNELAHYVAEVLPDASALLVAVVRGGLDDIDIMRLDLRSGALTPVVHATDARFHPPDALLFSRADRSVWAVGFDPRSGTVRGVPVPLLRGVVLGPGGWMELAVARNGTVLYQEGTGRPGVVMVQRNGGTVPIDSLGGLAGFGSPRVSPEGRRIVYERLSASATGTSDIWLYHLGDRTQTRLTFSGDNTYPEWSADGQLILFRANLEGVRTGSADGMIDTVRADGSGRPGHLFRRDGSNEEAVQSPDGRWIVFRSGDRGRNQNADLLYFAIDSPADVRPFAVSRFNERSPAFSPDGRWLAYTSDESGIDQVYVRPFPGPGPLIQVSATVGIEPVWSRTGLVLYYRGGPEILAATLDGGPRPRIAARTRVLPSGDYTVNANHAQYDVLPGDTTLVLVETGTAGRRMILAVHWLEERLSGIRR